MKPIALSTEAASLISAAPPGAAAVEPAQVSFDLLFALIAPVAVADAPEGEGQEFLPVSGMTRDAGLDAEPAPDDGFTGEGGAAAMAVVQGLDFAHQIAAPIPAPDLSLLPPTAVAVEWLTVQPSRRFGAISVEHKGSPDPAKVEVLSPEEPEARADQSLGEQILAEGAPAPMPKPIVVAKVEPQSALVAEGDPQPAIKASSPPAEHRQKAEVWGGTAKAEVKPTVGTPAPYGDAPEPPVAETIAPAPVVEGALKQRPAVARGANEARPANPVLPEVPVPEARVEQEVPPLMADGAAPVRAKHPALERGGAVVASAAPAVAAAPERVEILRDVPQAEAVTAPAVLPLDDVLAKAEPALPAAVGGGVQPAEASPAPRPAVAAPMPASAPLPETALNMRHNEWGRQLLDRIDRATRDGSEAFEISLRPKTLGALRVNLELQGDRTSVHFVTETGAAARMLLGSEDKLSQLLDQSGFRLSGFSAHGGGAGGQSGQPHKERAAVRSGKRVGAAAPDAPQVAPAQSPMGAGVNMLA